LLLAQLEMSSPSGKLSRVAIVGASSLRGKELKQTLEDRNFPAADIVLFDESFLAGTLTEAAGEPTFIRALDDDSFEGVRFAFFSGSQMDAEHSWATARNSGASVIDLTGAAAAQASAIIRIPSLSATMLSPPASRSEGTRPHLYYSPPAPVIIVSTVATALLKFNPKRVVLLLFPPVSERDQAGIEELEGQTANLLSFRPIEHPVFGAQVAFNLLAENGESSRPNLADARTAIARDVAAYLAGRAPVPAIQLVQAPVFYGYAFAAYAEFESAQPPEQLEAAFSNLGVKVSAPGDRAPSNVSVAGESQIQLARIQPDRNVSAGVWLWGAADNLRLATTNAVRIAEELLGPSSE
jgi:aspartate-semialdehyde dehydrogenase